jgi:hypothetical protein
MLSKLHHFAHSVNRPAGVLNQQPLGSKGEGEERRVVVDGGEKESWWESVKLTWKDVNEPKFVEHECYAILTKLLNLSDLSH